MKFRKRKVIISLILMICLTMNLSTVNYVWGADTTTGTEGLTIIGNTVMDYSGASTDVIIPDGVTSIGDYAFKDCKSLNSITLPDSVTSIGDSAFYYCTSLTRINLPSKVTRIGTSAFYGCINLSDINIPSGVKHIENSTFYGCMGLKNISIEEGVTDIGTGAFTQCSAMSNITLPDSVTSIGESAFFGCNKLTDITIPAKVTKIGNNTFTYCFALKSVDILGNVTQIGKYAFDSCSGLTSFTIPAGVTSIEEGTFNGCTSLTDMNIPASVTSIGSGVFNRCVGLKSVSIALGLFRIGDNAFNGCTGLTNIRIPSGVSKIEDSAFSGCTNLTSIIMPNSLTRLGLYVFYNCSKLNMTCYPDSVADVYANANSINKTPLQRATGISVDKSSLSLKKGDTTKLFATVTSPSNIADEKTVTWMSSDPSVVSVDKDGNLNAIKGGSAVIAAIASTSKPAISSTCEVTVAEPAPEPQPVVTVSKLAESIRMNQNKLYLTKGKVATLQATVTPSDTTNKAINWTSSNMNVATVDVSGNVTAIKNGTAVITVTTTDGSVKSAQCSVTVGYAVTYKCNGGINVEQNPGVVTGTSKVKLKNPTRSGFSFVGWYTDKKLTKGISSIAKGTKSSVTLYAKWDKVKVDKPTLSGMTNLKKKKININFGKVDGAKGYEVVYSTDKKFGKNTTTITTGKTSTTISKLEKGKKYYVKVRAYKIDSTGNKVYGKYSTVMNVLVTK